MQQMDLASWLKQIEACHPKRMDFDISRVLQVFRSLQISLEKTKIVKVAGTNGKGSFAHALAKLLTVAGKRVGVYTSPHLMVFNERLVIAQEMVSDEVFCRAFKKVEAHRGDTPLTYFEFTTLAVLIILSEQTLDYWILEIGMGGRLDAVNIVPCQLAVITSIAKDHTQWLGDTIAEIATEKAGIIDNHCCTLVGMRNPPPQIKQIAKAKQSVLYQRGQDFDFIRSNDSWLYKTAEQEEVHLPLPGVPLSSFSLATYAYKLLEGQAVSRNVLIESCSLTVPGRFQRVMGPVETILDVAHNAEACRHLSSRLKQLSPTRRLFAVVAMANDKDYSQALSPLISLISKWFVARLPGERGMSPAVIGKYLADNTGEVPFTALHIGKAYRQALAEANKGDKIIVFGSFQTVAAVVTELTDMGHHIDEMHEVKELADETHSIATY